jgi:hypothetical protein
MGISAIFFNLTVMINGKRYKETPHAKLPCVVEDLVRFFYRRECMHAYRQFDDIIALIAKFKNLK